MRTIGLNAPAVAAAIGRAKRIGMNVKSPGIVQGKHPLRQMADSVIVKIPRQIADPQFSALRLPPRVGQFLPQRLLPFLKQPSFGPSDPQSPRGGPSKYD